MGSNTPVRCMRDHSIIIFAFRWVSGGDRRAVFPVDTSITRFRIGVMSTINVDCEFLITGNILVH